MGFLIEMRLGSQFSAWTVGRYLKRWGFTPKKPLHHAHEQNPNSTRRWLRKEYSMLLRRAKREGAVIYWGSQTWIRSDLLIGRLYGLKGYCLDEFVEARPSRGRMISATTNRAQLCFMVCHKRYYGEVALEFMHRLVQITRKKSLFDHG